jgi:hypothetical protein
MAITTVPVDQRRRALEHRLELAKERLVADLGRFSSMIRSGTGTVRKSLFRGLVAAGGLLVLGIVALAMRRRRRLAWRLL